MFKLFMCDTLAVRFWLAVSSFLWATFIGFNPVLVPAFRLMVDFAPREVWALVFALNASVGIYSTITDTYSRWQYAIEIVFGTLLWVTLALVYIVSQNGVPSPALVGCLTSIWVLIRYPNIKGRKDVAN